MIVLDNLTKIYPNTTYGIKNINLSFNDKKLYCICGHSGSGKTTLLNVIGGFDNFDSGEIYIDGRKYSSLTIEEKDNLHQSYFGYVYQDFKLFNELTVEENILLCAKDNNIEEVTLLLDKLKLTGIKNHKVSEISAGQKQRTALGRVIIKKPKVILADEPTGNLDKKSSKIVMDLLKELSQNSLVIIVTHNNKLAQEYADKIINISEGIVEESFDTDLSLLQDSLVFNERKHNKKSFQMVRQKILNDDMDHKISYGIVLFVFFTINFLLINIVNVNLSTLFFRLFDKYDFQTYVVNELIEEKQNNYVGKNYINGYDFIDADEIKNSSKIYLTDICSINDEPIENLIYISDNYDNCSLIEGRFPQIDTEIVVSKYVYNSLNKVSTIKLDDMTYSICGVYDDFAGNVNANSLLPIGADYSYLQFTFYVKDTQSIFSYDSLTSFDCLRKNRKFMVLYRDTNTNLYSANSLNNADLIYGRLPTAKDEIVISNSYLNLLGLKWENCQDNYYHYDVDPSDDISYKNLFNPFMFINESVHIVGIVNSYKKDIYFNDDIYKELYEKYYDYFGNVSFIQKVNKDNVLSILNSNNFRINCPFSITLYEYYYIYNMVHIFLILSNIIISIIMCSYVARNIIVQFNNKKQQIGILLSLGFEKANIIKVFIANTFLELIIPFSLSTIISIFFFNMVNKIFSNYFLLNAGINLLTFSWYFYLGLLFIIFVVAFSTYQLLLRKLKNSNIITWLKL